MSNDRYIRLGVLCAVAIGIVVAWFVAISFTMFTDIEPTDIGITALALVFLTATTVYVSKFSLPVLESGFGILGYGYLLQLLDELALGPEYVENLGIPGLKLFGLVIILVGFVRTRTRLRSDIEQRKRRERMLERQNERLETLAAIVSHDLRNPLGIAQSYLDFAESEGKTEDFETVRNALDRADRMIANLSTLAEAETVVSDPEPVKIADIATDAWTTTETEAAELAVVAPDDWTVECNPEFLQNIFENLFRNSVTHNDSAVQIEVGLIDASESVGFYIEDDGTGIPDSEKSDVFDHGHTTSDEGTGLGLSIVSDLIEAHDWRISVSDSEAGGARFEIITADR
jgi:signal transduction histidine kinase